MRAIVIAGNGGPEVLEIREVATPEPRGEQVRIRVRAFGLNRADLLQARGFYPAPAGVAADIPGLEYSGEIESLGPDVLGVHQVGDRVFGIVAGGAQAEYIVAHERTVMPIPANLDFVQAAAVPEVFLTAHDALLTQGELKPGERVLIQAVGSGVGTAAAQIAHAMGCTVLGTSRTRGKLEKARHLGLDHGILATEARDIVEEVASATGGGGIHVVLELIGSSTLTASLQTLTPRGRIVVVGLLGGTKVSLDLGVLLAKRASLVGTTLRARPLEEKIAVTRLFGEQVLSWLARGTVKPVVDSVFSFEDTRQGLERLQSNESFGKVIIRF